jgi:hypothetical protein
VRLLAAILIVAGVMLLTGVVTFLANATETDVSQQQPFLGIGRDARRRSVHFWDSDLSACVALKGQYRSSQHAHTSVSHNVRGFKGLVGREGVSRSYLVLVKIGLDRDCRVALGLDRPLHQSSELSGGTGNRVALQGWQTAVNTRL